MKNLIIYDSVFGNTEQVANAICKAIASDGNTECLKVSDAGIQHLGNLHLLIVGSPTRKFQPTGAIKKFLKNIPSGQLRQVNVAAFDTRIAPEDTGSGLLKFLVKIFGYAARPIAKKLTKKGGIRTLDPQGFVVKGTKGPLKDGELERAANWARRIIEKSE